MYQGKFKIGELQTGCPEGVNPHKKHLYLSDEQFLGQFGVNKEDFEKLDPSEQRIEKQLQNLASDIN